MEITRMLDTKEAAKLLNISTSYVSKLCGRGDIVATRAFGDWRIPYEALMEKIQKETLAQSCRKEKFQVRKNFKAVA